jgi:hypothetical protein
MDETSWWSERRWEDNIKNNPKEVGCAGSDWHPLAQDRDQWWAHIKAVTNIVVP